MILFQYTLVLPITLQQPGTWTFQIFNLALVAEEVFCTISSYATDPNVEPIVVTSELSGTFTDFVNQELVSVFSEVRQGVKPIIHADVWAIVHQPGGTQTQPFKLKDDGAGKICEHFFFHSANLL